MEELESQRPGNDKQTQIVRSYIESGAYRRKFDQISDSVELPRLLYKIAKEMLFHRSGTRYEDMYWVDLEGIEIVAKEIECGSEECIAYSKATWDAIEEYPNRLLTLHTHPNSMPPSVDDFNSCFINGYVAGLVICHNGKIYQYTSRQYVEPKYFDLTVAGFLNMGYNEVEAQLAAISEVSKHFDIMFKEVTDNDGCARE